MSSQLSSPGTQEYLPFEDEFSDTGLYLIEDHPTLYQKERTLAVLEFALRGNYPSDALAEAKYRRWAEIMYILIPEGEYTVGELKEEIGAVYVTNMRSTKRVRGADNPRLKEAQEFLRKTRNLL